MNKEEMFILYALLAFAIIGIVAFFVRRALVHYKAQLQRQSRQLNLELDRMDIDRATWKACQVILDELRCVHLPLDEDWQRWQLESIDRELAHDTDNLFMSDSPDYGSDADMDWTDDDLAIPGDGLWG